MNRNVFTYGSLMFDAVWSLVVAGDYASIEAHLEHHARFAIADQDYPGMVARSDAQTTGVLHLAVDSADLVRLDLFEGDDYLRAAVVVQCADGSIRPAETYLYCLEDRLLAMPWQPDAFSMQRFIETYCRDRLG